MTNITVNLIRHAVATFLFLAVGATTFAAAAQKQGPACNNLTSEPALRQKLSTCINSEDRSFLTARDGDTIRAWVLFTDKGISDKTGFRARAASVQLTERALNRRAKVGLDRVVFADLPVHEKYVREIESTGATHRRSSRWLNAATFYIPNDKLDAVGALPFVAEIKPMMVFSRPVTAPDMTKPVVPVPISSYGLSLHQLTQLNVVNAHTAGFTGRNVTLAIMDSGYRKTHKAFENHYSAGRVLAEWDFIQNDGNTANEGGDVTAQWDHGTKVWSVAAGEDDGDLFGPAYQANIILCKTEDIPTETHAEEDNWVAALEFSDSIGVDVISTSLGYSTFDSGVNYTYEDLDGLTTIIGAAASTCDGLGIVMVNSMGNSGASAGSLTSPADAFDILSVGNVDADGNISYSSSRGPTYDGRIKPELCARGTSTRCASPFSDTQYGNFSGTSFSAPLIAGVACLVIQAHPDWTPAQVREALMLSADNAASPNNTYGWGIPDVMDAINWNFNSGCCTGASRGNIDGSADQLISMGDLVVLIDHLFIDLNPLTCIDEADIDQSGGASPGSLDITIADLTTLIDHLFISLAPLPACP